jgi:FAD/FMN-containing dehydrogenase
MSNIIEALTETMRGRVITRSDSDYDEARAVYNAMHDRKPRAVIQCVDSADVMAAVAAGRDAGLDVAIRGGGHSVPGFGTVEDGLVIDLSKMKNVRVDPIKKVARVGGGATWGDVDHATYPFGLAAVSVGNGAAVGRRNSPVSDAERSLSALPAVASRSTFGDTHFSSRRIS